MRSRPLAFRFRRSFGVPVAIVLWILLAPLSLPSAPGFSESPRLALSPGHLAPKAPESSLASTPRGLGPAPNAATAHPSSPTEKPTPSPGAAHPAALVNPTAGYSHEPAPMGIADFGVTGRGPTATGYAYSSDVFQGQAVVRSLSVTITGSSSKVTAFELNAVVLFQRNGTNYSYWVQNGLHLDAGTDVFSIGGAYVWNFSAPGARLTAGELVGAAGSALATDTYYFIPNCAASFGGQCRPLSLPATLVGRIVTSETSGVPYVAYQYNLGSGWVTYDNVSFPRMAGATDCGFFVNGFATTPYAGSLYYDAEWIWAGAGGGSSATDQHSDIDMSLDFFNGHNYQAVPTAWDFGSNTGETSTNVSDSIASNPRSEPAAHLASGAGSLGVLYNGTSVGFANVTVPVLTPITQTLLVDGRSTLFWGGWANLTLPAGTHSLSLLGYSNATVSVAVTSGGTTHVDLSGAGRLVFTEVGLPKGTYWGLWVNGTITLNSLLTTLSAAVFNLPNGTYSVSYDPVPGYFRNGTDPSSVTMPGSTVVRIHFAVFQYLVSVTESGLPTSTPWWVKVNHTVVPGSGTTISVSAPNGSTPYEVGASYEFVPNPTRGNITVSHGVPVPVNVDFTYRPSYIAGNVTPVNATVTIDGSPQTVNAGSFQDLVIPGTYLLTVSAPGFVTKSQNVTATPGNTTWVDVPLVVHTGIPKPGNPAPSNSGTIPVGTAVLIAVAVAVGAGALLYLVYRRRGPPMEPGPPEE